MKYRKFFFTMILLILLGAILTLLSPLLIQFWNLQGSDLNSSQIFLLLMLLLLTLVIEVFVTVLRERFAKEFNKQNLKDYLQRYFKLNYDYVLREGPTTLFERIIIAVNHVYLYMAGDLVRIWSSILITVAILLFTAFNHLSIFFILLAMIPINYLGYKVLNQELSKRSDLLQRTTASGWQKILSAIRETDYLK